MCRTCRLAFILLLGLPLASVNAADSEAAAWLERMVRSAHQLNYIGTFVYQQNGSLQSMRIIHAATDEGEHERLVSLSGPNREVVRSRERVTCILPEDSPIVVENAGAKRPFPYKLPSNLEPLRRHYTITLAGEERVAGLTSKKVVISPRDQYRYGQSFWLGNDTGLLLRAEMLNEQGRVIEQVMFTSLELRDAIPEKLLKPQVDDRDQVVELEGGDLRSAPSEESSEKNWRVEALPPGFILQLQRKHYLPHKQYPVEHLVFSDGLASVSVFIEKLDEDENAFVGASSLGGVNAYGRVLGEHTVTVLGEVPPITVKQIAESLQRVAP